MDTPHDLAAVEQLLAERDALHEWLARLDGAGSTVPPPVRTRVRQDYEGRLDGVTDRLRAHADTIAQKLSEDRGEHAELLRSATMAREALAEAELRHAVGEYDRSRFDDERTRHASDIETYDLSLGAVAERIARLEDVHQLISRPPRPADPDTPKAPVFHEHHGPELPALDDVPPLEVIATLAAEVEPVAIGIGDLAPDDADQLLAIFDDSGSIIQHDDGRGPLSFRPSSSTHVEPPPRATHAAPAPSRGEVEGGNGAADVMVSDTPPAAVDAGAMPSVARTVRCGECGAMNRPMEWYCEKCGAELTAV